MPEATQDLEVYLVGGAVRDELLGETVKDRDWVVVGSTPEAMLALGFKAVGREFPVFLHPQTKEEYALARTEKKVAPGYTGFVFNTAPEVTLEQDLRRRDLTINAMARDSSGRLVDPFSGKRDLERGILRHVSDAFVEDPVRVLRVARFRARFGFEVARETLDLMRQLSQSGEVDALVAERVWAELVGALSETRPSLFFETLRDCEALQRIFPEIHALFGVPQRKEYHPEIDTGVHTMLALDAVSTLSSDLTVRCAVLLHDLGKARTPREQWPRHHGHEALGVPLVRAFCERLRAPRSYRDLALLVCRYHLRMHKLSELKAATILDLLERLDGFRKPERITQFALACEADSRGRAGLEDVPYPQAAWLANCFAAAAAVDGAALAAGRDDSTAIAAEIRRARCAAIQKVQDQFANT